MFRLVSSLAVCTLAICLASAASSSSETWIEQFRSKINVLPKPSGNCFVCFYEQTNFTGQKFCVGRSARGRTEVNPILAPLTIASIKFEKDCNLVVNVRVTDVPFDEYVAVFSKDVANANYNFTTSEHSIQEIYVEEAGRACFLGVPKSGKGYGVCYSDAVPVVEDEYRNSITELMLFKTDTKTCDVIVYENDYYNNPHNSLLQSVVNLLGLEQRFSGYSNMLKTNEIDPISGMNKTMQNKVRSFKFVSTLIH
ncbi:unnamed protein product [Peronospora farinosa]|uniref:Uncharacterized protein n=1 Tax=Peronospora farinosa TaxID=134698 RepID=A0AAV0UGV4_9STRA|nr:unnamed protein product [Peronospora farinosa]CAI5735583.1 unnamed protein product [Peronospora farinosa]